MIALMAVRPSIRTEKGSAEVKTHEAALTIATLIADKITAAPVPVVAVVGCEHCMVIALTERNPHPCLASTRSRS